MPYLSNHLKLLLAFVFFAMVIYPSSTFAQKKKNVESHVAAAIVSFEVLDNGDTINQTDAKQMKQGKWLIEHAEQYGESGYLEYGSYVNNIKIGRWQNFTLDGRILSDEFYKKGNKDGEAKYYEDGSLFCIGHFMALNSSKVYDTIEVEDPLTNQFNKITIKTDAGSVRHGFWTYYDTQTKEINKIVEYQVDEIVYEREYLSKKDSVYIEAKMKTWPHVTQKESSPVWPIGKNKKPVRYTDFSENTDYVKPNVRKEKH
ncbi:MAG: hypothetical protein KA198_05800 [Chitinophagaceae bacterium]|nr:hypothetical protein [Chitinophagaceae bacterium]